MVFISKIENKKIKFNNNGFSMIEVIVVIALAGFALIALSSLFLRTSLTKTTNENLLLASNLASDVMEHIKKVSINNYDSLQELLKYDDTKNIDFKDIFDETNPMTELYDDSPPASLNSLPDSKNLSYVYFEVLERNLSNPLIVNKILAKIVIKWKEITREQNSEREYSIATYIFKNGLGNFLK